MLTLDKNMKYLCCVLLFLIVVYIVVKMLRKPNTKNSEKALVPPKPKMKTQRDKVSFYYSDSCPHCNNQKKIIDSAGLKDNFKFVHCPDNREECEANQIEGVPAFMKNGKMVAVGVQKEDDLKKLLD